MKRTQEIFDQVIEAGFYDPTYPPTGKKCVFMCDALNSAAVHGLITKYEAENLKNEIDIYIKGAWTLRAELKRNKLPNSPCDLLSIYMDWDNRPQLF